MLNPLFWNILLYLFCFLWLFEKEKRRFSLATSIILMEVIIAFLGFYSFESGIYQLTFGRKDENRLSFIPYILNFIAVLIILVPLRNYKIIKIRLNNNVKFIFNILSYVTCVLSLLYSVALYFVSKAFASLSFAEVYAIGRSGEMVSFNIPLIDFIFTQVYQWINILTPFVFTYNFYNISRNCKVKTSIIIILLVFLLQFAACVVLASRGRLFFLFTSLLYFLILFHGMFSKKTKKWVKMIVACFFLLALVFSILISESRTENSSQKTTFGGIVRYFGEPFPNLCYSYWNATNIQHPMGRRHYYGIYHRIDDSINLKLSVGERQDYWTSYTKVPVYNFKTIYGDLYVEFGIFIPFVILSCISSFYLFIRRKMSLVYSVILIYYCYHMCVFGLFDFIADVGLFETMIGLILCLFIEFISNFKSRSFKLSRVKNQLI